MNILGKIIGVVLIIAAFYSLDFNYWNQIIISVILSLSGVHLLLMDSKSESIKRLANFLQKTALVLAIILIIKLFIVG